MNKETDIYNKYYGAGGEVQIKANGEKEIHITDNLGSVRCIIVGDGTNIRSYDYKPFGELEWSSDNKTERKGFANAEYDGESSYFAMGIRMYSAEMGRFLAVDPMFEAMPRHTPYHYSFNSPLVYCDPSGLAPQKEKHSEKLQMYQLPDYEEKCTDYYRLAELEHDRFMIADAIFTANYVAYLDKQKAKKNAQGGKQGDGNNGCSKYPGSDGRSSGSVGARTVKNSDYDYSGNLGDKCSLSERFETKEGGTRWKNMSPEERMAILKEPDNFLRDISINDDGSSFEWAYSIFEVEKSDGFYIIVTNFRTDGLETFVHPNVALEDSPDYCSVENVGWGHSHNENQNFTDGDIRCMYECLIYHEDTQCGYTIVATGKTTNYFITMTNSKTFFETYNNVNIHDYFKGDLPRNNFSEILKNTKTNYNYWGLTHYNTSPPKPIYPNFKR